MNSMQKVYTLAKEIKECSIEEMTELLRTGKWIATTVIYKNNERIYSVIRVL